LSSDCATSSLLCHSHKPRQLLERSPSILPRCCPGDHPSAIIHRPIPTSSICASETDFSNYLVLCATGAGYSTLPIFYRLNLSHPLCSSHQTTPRPQHPNLYAPCTPPTHNNLCAHRTRKKILPFPAVTCQYPKLNFSYPPGLFSHYFFLIALVPLGSRVVH
jgi:hypothetical protein